MTELVFKSERGNAVTTSLLVAEKFGKRHSDVLRSIDSIINQSPESQSKRNFAFSDYTDTTGKSNPLCVMTRDGFSILVMGFTGEAAIRFKWEFIDAFNQMEETIHNGSFQVPSSFREALLLAARQQEQIENQQKQLEAQAPKVLFADAVAASQKSCLVGEMAKILRQNGIDMGQQRLFKWLRRSGYLCKSGERYNQPTQLAMEQGLMELKKTSIARPDGTIMVTTTPKITGKGQIHFVHLFMKAALMLAE